jgi:hypothetical protein
VLLFLGFAGCGGRGGGGRTASSPPSNPTASVTSDRVLLSWSASSGLPDGYLVEQSSDGSSFTQIQTVTETTALVDGLTNGQRYFFRVRSFNSAGNSSYSPTVTVTL